MAESSPARGGLSARERVLALGGLAVLRAGAAGRWEEAGRELDALRARATAPASEEPGEEGCAERCAVDARTGYAAWAATYDEPGNVTVAVEEPVVRELLGALAPGMALDAGCGTGRHAAFLAERGHGVVGVDASPEMLARAADNVPGADLRLGELDDLPLAGATFDAAICALALSHVPDLTQPFSELARVLRPGGSLVVSTPHPIATGLLGWRTRVPLGGAAAFVPEFPHSHADYVSAAVGAGLLVRRCIEPAMTAAQARRKAKGLAPETQVAALAGLPVVLVWEFERAGG